MADDGPGLLAAARADASFVPEDLSVILYGGAEKLARKRELVTMAADDPVLSRRNQYFLSREDAYKHVLGKACHAVRVSKEAGLSMEDTWVYFDSAQERMPLDLHRSMFMMTLFSQTSDEQRADWLVKAMNFDIIGCYAQTELGHGSNVRGLETTATYDIEAEEFVLHSPTLTSMKWWPGGLGKTANHAVTHARLIIGDTDHGVHPFFVQLRSLEDHSPLPGVTVGDIGPKLGYHTQDNGFLRFDQVRIPRYNLLAKYQQVTREGEYVKQGHAKLNYGTMIGIRASIVNGAGRVLGQGVTIATRYAFVRRQFGPPNAPERQIISYKMQQNRLFTLLATVYAFHFTGVHMKRMYDNYMAGLESLDTSSLPELHASSSGLKAFTTWTTLEGLEDCRQCCGGHGYSKFSGIPELWMDYAPAVTYEGDNVVLCQQTARYLLKSYAAHLKGDDLVPSLQHLSDLSVTSAVCRVRDAAGFRDGNLHVKAFQHRAASLVVRVSRTLAALQADGMTYDEAWNELQPDLVAMTKAHCFFIMVREFTKAVDAIEAPEIRRVLQRLSALFALHNIREDMGDWLESGFLKPSHCAMVRSAIGTLLEEIYPDAVALVDALDYDDYVLNSSLGRYDGDVYNHMVAWAKEEPLNKEHTVLDSFDLHLKPLLKARL